uniref:DDE Tnp4 domain-containing protein n=1 Tax=Anopheles epiroticus TaxID=199890 RepID=A0A182PVT2_9DIPT
YLSTGLSFRAIASSFRISHQTIASIVYETCEAIWKALQPIHLPVPTTESLLELVQEFEMKWNFPNCIGAIDGKHWILEIMDDGATVVYLLALLHLGTLKITRLMYPFLDPCQEQITICLMY